MTAEPAFEVVAARGVAIRYPFAMKDAVGPLDFQVQKGERVLLLGPSGCGKSTLLHALTGLLPLSIPAELRGALRLFGTSVGDRSPADWADRVAILFQDADQTLAGFTVADEIAFALENRNHPPSTMARAVMQAMALAGLPADWLSRRIGSLSGGQKQLVALAAALAQGGDLLIADEPTANLAPAAARILVDRILAPGQTALVVDHRLGPLLERIDRVIVLDPNGRLLVEGSPDKVFALHGERLVEAGIWVPRAVSLRLTLGLQGHAVPSLWRMSDLCKSLPKGVDVAPLILPKPAKLGDLIVRLDRVSCAPPFGPVVLRDITLSLRSGEVLGILGPNGAGKSTLATCLAGLIPPRAGRREGPAGAVVFQNPEAHFTTDSVRAELAAVGIPRERHDRFLNDWGLCAQGDQHPYTLSMGQKRRLALMLVTATNRWPVIILDEPTAGLDQSGVGQVANHVRALAKKKRATVVITHDVDFALSVCDRTIILDKGAIVADGPALQILRDTARLEAAGLCSPEVAPLLQMMR